MSISIVRRIALCAILGGAASANAASVSDSFCTASSVTVLYFNGVRTTRGKAELSIQHLRRLYGTSTTSGRGIGYKLAYNATTYQERSITKIGWNDVLETFEQRFSQQSSAIANRIEVFFEAIHGGGIFSDSIATVSPAYSEFVASLADPIKARYISSLLSMNSSTLNDYADHQDIITNEINAGNGLLLYAHSQGNLFANQAYRFARLKISDDSVKVVHIAPASSQLYGDYVLADGDLVINVGLRQTGASLPVANASIPPFSTRPPGLRSSERDDGRDIYGHGLLAIYLNNNITPLITQPLELSKRIMRSALGGIVLPCPTGGVELRYNNFAGRFLLDGYDYGYFIPSGIDPNTMRSIFIDKLRPGRHSIGVLSQSSSGVLPRISVGVSGSYRLANSALPSGGPVPTGGTLSVEFIVPPL